MIHAFIIIISKRNQSIILKYEILKGTILMIITSQNLTPKLKTLHIVTSNHNNTQNINDTKTLMLAISRFKCTQRQHTGKTKRFYISYVTFLKNCHGFATHLSKKDFILAIHKKSTIRGSKLLHLVGTNRN